MREVLQNYEEGIKVGGVRYSNYRLARQFKKSQDLRGRNCNQKENSLLENIQKNIAIMTFKSLNNLTPVNLKQCFQYSSDVHRYKIRKREKVICRTEKQHMANKNIQSKGY